MTDDLRTRIAYAIAQEDGDLPGMEPDSSDYVVADAVIRELGLRIQVAGPDGIVGTGDYRYVTEWETDD